MLQYGTIEQPLLGSHMSIAGGVHKAIELGASVRCTSIQIFTASNNRWKGKTLNPGDMLLFKKLQKKQNIQHVISHDSYLHNLASPDSNLVDKSIKGMINELNRCELLEIPYMVFHPGSATDGKKGRGINCITRSIKRILRESKNSVTTLCLENTAGAGNEIGSMFEELASILEKVNRPQRMGICIDTCHLFSAGYDFTSKVKYNKLFSLFSKFIGMEYLKVLHVNDSKYPLGSNKDRHEHIGKGFIGKEPFGFFMNDKKITHIPKILETKKGKDLKEDKINMRVLKSLIRKK